MARQGPKPFQQGQLDGLCGIYALVNAIRLAASGTGTRLSDEAWRELFSALMAEVDDIIGAAAVAAYGIDTKPLRKLMKFAARHLADEHDLRVEMSRVAKKKDRIQKSQLLRLLTAISRDPNSAALIALTGPLNHWTVIKSVAKTSLELFDSSGYSRVKLSNCRLSHQQLKTGREHIICPRDVFRVTLRA